MRNPCNICSLSTSSSCWQKILKAIHVIPLTALSFKSFLFLWKDMKRNQNLLEFTMISNSTYTIKSHPCCPCWVRAGVPSRDLIMVYQPPMLHPYSRHLAKNVSTLAILQMWLFLTLTLHPQTTQCSRLRKGILAFVYTFLSLSSQENHLSAHEVVCSFSPMFFAQAQNMMVSAWRPWWVLLGTTKSNWTGNFPIPKSFPINTGSSLTTWAGL